MNSYRSVLLISIAWLLISCNKNDEFPPFNPPVLDTTFVQYGTPFAGVPDREDAVIYQVNICAFSATGDFQGVIARLDSIKALGVNVIYLMPIYPVGTVNSVNSPYCVKDYVAVNSEFGTLDDLRQLVDGAHSRNMSVMLDWVANHTAWDHPWISAHKDWYLQDNAGNILIPPGTNYTDVAQLDFNSSAMRLEMIKDMQYWVYEANVDGFRFDYVDGPPIDFWEQAVVALRKISTHNLLLLAEGAGSENYTAGFDYIFGFNFYGNLKQIFSSNKSVTSIDGLNISEYTNASNGQQVVRFTTNHDVNSSDATPLALFGGEDGSLAAFAVIACMKSIPMIYSGQEVGMTQQIFFPFTATNINWSANTQITQSYKEILAFRNAHEAVRKGTLVTYSTNDVCAFTKELGSKKVLVIINLRNTTVNFTIPAALANTSWTDVNGSNITLSGSTALQPYSYSLLKN
ncbi:MAG TPA: alpha-amylase family glycosyl hydrolase [Chitinophagales bacterium]|nr:alpha-amylase family glycosyl hydrolase [Chitinophagales bacterium]